MIAIQNEQFTAAIRIRGAELASFKDRSTGRERIWQADPEIWNGSAPILFPIVGRLKNGLTLINNQPYEIPKHGLLRTRDVCLVEQGAGFALFQFESDDETLKQYPFPFVFRVMFTLTDAGLSVDYEIHNSGTEPMLFSVGSHPAFALDLERHALSEYSIEFSEPETLDRYGLEDGLLVLKDTGYLKDETKIPLSESLFADDALIFQNVRSRTVRIKPAGLEIDLGNHPHLGLWAKPGAAYVCIEPWHSFDDTKESDGRFENKPGILRLPPGECFKTGYMIKQA